MEPDETRRKSDETISPTDDLTILGLEQLRERLALLQTEMDRTRAMMESKDAGLAAAQSLFKT